MKLKSLFEPCSKLLSKFKKHKKPSSVKVRPRMCSCGCYRTKRTSRSHRKPVQNAVEDAAGEIEEDAAVDLASLGEAPFLLPITTLFPRNSSAEDDNSEDVKESCRNSSRGIAKDESFEDADDVKELCRNSSASITKDESFEDTEESCGSFEKCLVEMIVKEGKLKDLKDMEELLYCWKNLKSPIFIHFVSSFYEDLFMDSSSSQEDEP